MAHVRKEPTEREKELFTAAYKIACKDGIKKVTKAAVAASVGVSAGLVGAYFGRREALREAIFKHAVAEKNAKLVRDGLDNGFGAGVRIPKDLRAAATA